MVRERSEQVKVRFGRLSIYAFVLELVMFVVTIAFGSG